MEIFIIVLLVFGIGIVFQSIRENNKTNMNNNYLGFGSLPPPANKTTPVATIITLLPHEKKYPPKATFFSREETIIGGYEENFLNAYELKYWNQNKSRIILEEETKRKKLALSKENNKQNLADKSFSEGSGKEKPLDQTK